MNLLKIFLLTLCIILAFLATACSTTVPVTAKFPDVPVSLLNKCPQLEKLKEDAKLSDISKTVAINYTTYYECAVRNDAWVEWYRIQKHIFESVK